MSRDEFCRSDEGPKQIGTLLNLGKHDQAVNLLKVCSEARANTMTYKDYGNAIEDARDPNDAQNKAYAIEQKFKSDKQSGLFAGVEESQKNASKPLCRLDLTELGDKPLVSQEDFNKIVWCSERTDQ